MDKTKIRNIAIIAHVDHGKTTLVDSFLKQSRIFRENEAIMQENLIMDNNDLERERGITIVAKNISIPYKEYKINIIDTPGHADFGGEVERTLNMADGCLLVIDAQEGPMPQTRFVLKKALEMEKKIIVVINKIDKKLANIDQTLSRIYDLFLELAQTEDQLDFPIYYAIAKDGKAFESMPDNMEANADMTVLFEGIIKHIPSPAVKEEAPFLMQISAIDYDSYIGSGFIGKILQGTAKTGDNLTLLGKEDSTENFKISKILVNNGLKKEEREEAFSGEIITIVGVKSAKIGDTITKPGHNERLPDIQIQEPAVKIKFEANTSPFSGQEGKFVTSRQLLARLQKELEKNVGMKLEITGDQFYVSGRGELHLSILIETLRREGYEFQISRPEAIVKIVDGKQFDVREELIIDTNEEYIGEITTICSKRGAELDNMINEGSGRVRFYYKILTKNLFGLRAEVLNQTRGTTTVNHSFLDLVEFKSAAKRERKGVILASDNGTSTAYGIMNAQERGILFIGPEERIYKGMIVGINKYDQDIEVNVAKQKHLTNIHKEGQEDAMVFNPKIEVTIEYGVSFINEDELLEITPDHLRLRKKFLDKNEREKQSKQ